MVHQLLGIDDRVDHLLRICAERWQLKPEVNDRLCRCAADIHDTVDGHIVGLERGTDVEVRQRYAVEGIDSLHL